MKPITLLGIDLQPYSYASLLEQIGQWIADAVSLQQICTVNPEFYVIASQDTAFYAVMQSAICVADGIGIMIGARIIGERLPQRVTGSDAIDYIAAASAKQGWRLYLLGAAPGVAQKAAAVLQDRYPGTRIVGTFAGSPHPEEAHDIINQINASQIDILLVAYGAPAQDMWIAEHRAQLQVHVAIGVGGAFDYIAGVVPRAPAWMRRAGLEWLYRLLRQPSRWRRMLRLPLFLLLVLRKGKQRLHEATI